MLFVFLLLAPFVVNGASYIKGVQEMNFNRTASLARTNAAIGFSSCGAEKKYMVGVQKVTWFQALVLCQQNDMELATVGSAEEEAVIEGILEGYPTTLGVNKGYWISAARMGSCNSEFVFFSNGKPLIYNVFAPGQPDNAGGVESCIEIFKDSEKKYYWNDLPCDNSNNRIGFICQTKNCC